MSQSDAPRRAVDDFAAQTGRVLRAVGGGLAGQRGSADQAGERGILALHHLDGHGDGRVCGALDGSHAAEGHGIPVQRPARKAAPDCVGAAGRNAVGGRQHADHLRACATWAWPSRFRLWNTNSLVGLFVGLPAVQGTARLAGEGLGEGGGRCGGDCVWRGGAGRGHGAAKCGHAGQGRDRDHRCAGRGRACLAPCTFPTARPTSAA